MGLHIYIYLYILLFSPALPISCALFAEYSFFQSTIAQARGQTVTDNMMNAAVRVGTGGSGGFQEEVTVKVMTKRQVGGGGGGGGVVVVC